MSNIIEREDFDLAITNGKSGITVGLTLKNVKKTVLNVIASRLEDKKYSLKYTRHSKKCEKLVKEIKQLEGYIAELNN